MCLFVSFPFNLLFPLTPSYPPPHPQPMSFRRSLHESGAPALDVVEQILSTLISSRFKLNRQIDTVRFARMPTLEKNIFAYHVLLVMSGEGSWENKMGRERESARGMRERLSYRMHRGGNYWRCLLDIVVNWC